MMEERKRGRWNTVVFFLFGFIAYRVNVSEQRSRARARAREVKSERGSPSGSSNFQSLEAVFWSSSRCWTFSLMSCGQKLLRCVTLNLVFRLSHFLATWSGVIFPVRLISLTIPLQTEQHR